MDEKEAQEMVEKDPQAHGSAGLLVRLTDLEERIVALEGKKTKSNQKTAAE
jgi:hypothetical protein